MGGLKVDGILPFASFVLFVVQSMKQVLPAAGRDGSFMVKNILSGGERNTYFYVLTSVTPHA